MKHAPGCICVVCDELRPNPFDVICLRMITANAAAIRDYLEADPADAALFRSARTLSDGLTTKLTALEDRARRGVN